VGGVVAGSNGNYMEKVQVLDDQFELNMWVIVDASDDDVSSINRDLNYGL
jgi:hypothetical protein